MDLLKKLLGNGSVNTFPSVTLSTVEGRPLLGNASLDTFSQQRINKSSLGVKEIFSMESRISQSRVEAGSNTSTVALRVVGGDGKGSLESETVKYGHESHGTQYIFI
jgi:hypothetical protein